MLEVDREVGRRIGDVECGRNDPEAKVSEVRAFVRPLVHRMMTQPFARIRRVIKKKKKKKEEGGR